jgi:hypothetical protein
MMVNFSPKFELPVYDNKEQVKKAMITCHFCGETGHKAVSCFKVQQGQIPQTVQDGNKIEIQAQSQTNPPIQVGYFSQSSENCSCYHFYFIFNIMFIFILFFLIKSGQLRPF